MALLRKKISAQEKLIFFSPENAVDTDKALMFKCLYGLPV